MSGLKPQSQTSFLHQHSVPQDGVCQSEVSGAVGMLSMSLARWYSSKLSSEERLLSSEPLEVDSGRCCSSGFGGEVSKSISLDVVKVVGISGG